ncbi:carboxylesterase family protein [Fusobacterium simiae]|uniref:Carboxylic ester hydrolase n=1 Tax=Fusobacterium simiae TaxID=855 RepID=A0ABT4DH22_FUSSI|nr:carboxylesterase family protein [Fusobacterium simiae]MCY7007900.1 carboxylesterase family protein [Fusobacterium simiae]
MINIKKLLLSSVLLLNLTIGGISYAKNDIRIIKPDVAVVTINQGKVQGYIHNGIFTYRGIPYATAERFEAPKKIENSNKTIIALKNGHIAPQNSFNPMDNVLFNGPLLTQGDDCQNLNVWTPSISDNKKRPVMVWLHGGGHMAGSSMESYAYDGENLSKKGDIVVVSINHRLNAMGYLDLSEYGEKYKNSANHGIMDIVVALEWIRDNISKFGGDPNNVTLFGESGGGAKILTLMGTPAAKGLFHKAIVESGAVEMMGMTLPKKETTKRVAELTLQNLGLTKNNVDKIKELPFSQIEEAGNKALKQTAEEQKIPNLQGNGYGLNWAPTVDGNYIPADPVGDKFSDLAKDIPLIIGTNLTEWETIYAGLLAPDNLANAQKDNRNTWSEKEKIAKIKEKYGDKADKVLAEFKKAYPDRNIADVLYVETFLRPRALKTARVKAEQKGAPVYMYVFTWDTPLLNGIPMSYHTSEIPFVMNNAKDYDVATGGGEDAIKMADKMSQAWINFARTGNPNVKGQPNWQPYTRENGNTMIFDNNSKTVKNHDLELMKTLMPNYGF